MNDSIYLCIKGVKINQIPEFYKKFKRISENKIYKYHYKGILFNYFLTSCSLLIMTTSSKILGKNDIKESDVDEFVEKLKSIILEIVDIDIKKIKLNVCRFDYKVDVPMEDKERHEMFNLLNKHKMRYRYIRMRKIYQTSIHLANHSSSRNINIYDKGVESGIPEFENVVRLELQIKHTGIIRLLNKEEKPRDIYYYWGKEAMEELFFKYFEGFLYTGTYYKLGQAIKIIEKSSYTRTLKKGLISFVSIVNKNGMLGAERFFSYNTIRKYEKLLDNINVNPITIEDDAEINEMENLLKRARRIAEEKYFK